VRAPAGVDGGELAAPAEPGRLVVGALAVAGRLVVGAPDTR
jgi:hypothetical protein